MLLEECCQWTCSTQGCHRPSTCKKRNKARSACIHMCLNIHTYTCIYISIYVHVCACMYTFVCAHICMCVESTLWKTPLPSPCHSPFIVWWISTRLLWQRTEWVVPGDPQLLVEPLGASRVWPSPTSQPPERVKALRLPSTAQSVLVPLMKEWVIHYRTRFLNSSACLHLLLAALVVVTFTFSSFSFGDHFEWNKVTSCVHNILSGQRWIEHYGEIVIKNLNDDSCHCKVNFIKVTWVAW